ncbi:unnamed protein product [Cunninghamella blakesleeana]
MFDTINSTLTKGGSVLLPSDSAARVLELCYVLDQYWTNNQLNYPLIMLSNTSYHTIHFAKIMLEWMGTDLTKHFSQTRENPFEFKYLRLFHKLEDLEQYPGPKVVIASNYSLDTGFARDLFIKWMTIPMNGDDNDDNDDPIIVKNTLLLTERSQPGSLARQMFDQWESEANKLIKDDPSLSTGKSGSKAIIRPGIDYNTEMDLTLFQRVPLEGEELQVFEAAQRAKAEREAAQAAMIARNKTIMEDESDSSDLDEADDPMEDLLANQHDLYVRDSGRSGGFFKQAQSYHMFPYHEKRKKIDDYGEAIQQDHYILASDLTRLLENKQSTASENGANFGNGNADQSGKKENNEMKMDIDEPLLNAKDNTPTKYISNDQHVQVQCFLRYIDLEGLSDNISIKNILSQIAPRKMILIHGQEDATNNLATTCSSMNHFTKEIFTPNIGEVLNVSSATNIYQVRLTDGLVNTLHFSKLEDYELARVSGRIHFRDDSTTPSLDIIDDMMEIQKKKIEPTIFVGDTRLTEFKRILQGEGISAEFKGEGMLVCNDHVVVRKVSLLFFEEKIILYSYYPFPDNF